MTCANCQTVIPSGATFCPDCGTKAGAVVATPRRAVPTVGTMSGHGTVVPMRDTPTSVLANGSLFANRYEVLGKIGEGGMGVVYLTRDANSADEVVLKLIHPDLVADEAVKRLLAEGVTARRINHPSVVRVFDVTKWEGQPYFTMEHVKGGSLRTWLIKQSRSGTRVPLATAIGLTKAILAGLGEAHRMDVVHRDLKPENVLLVSDPAAGVFDLKILDFGIARALSGPLSTNRPSGPVGTLHYMAPEQTTSAEVAGPAADFYSVTVMLYELLIGVLPQARYEPVSTLRPEIPKALDAVIHKGLTAMPSGRYGSAAAYAAALDAVPPQAAPEPTPEPVRPPPPPPPPPSGPGWWKTYQAWWAGLSTMAKAGLVGGIVVVGVVANLVDPTTPPTRTGVVDSGGGEVPDDDRDVTPEPPPPPPVRPLPNIAGQWVHGNGLVLRIAFSGRQFSGTGNGGQRIEGAFDNDWNAAFSVWDGYGNPLFQTRDARLVDTGSGFHLVYANGSQELFINHQPH